MDQARVIETAAGGSLGALIRKLASLTLDQVSQLRGISVNIEWLKEELQILHAVLLDLSNEEDPTHQQKLWKNKIRELAYDIEDAIDKFVLTSKNEHARSLQEAQDSNYADRIIATIRSCTDRIKSLPSDYQIATEIQGLKYRIAAAEDRHKSLKTVDNSDGSSYDSIAIRDIAPYMDATGLVGIEAPSGHIIHMLTEGDNSSAHRRKVVSIVGFGGLGKTTLAKQVFDRIPGEFDCKAFVPVSRKPDINKVLRDILLDFGSGDKLDELRQFDRRQLMDKLRGYIRKKRYLVVVDDIWDKDAWRILKGALFDNNFGSRIIVTTRKNDVAEECCSCTSDHVYRIKPLNNDNSERLFIDKVFGRKRCPPYLKDACDRILKKCAGSPLAILTMSGLLANKVTVSQWEEVLRSLSYAVPDNSDVEAMRRILSFSYFDLPQHLRTCLLYLSIFPEDRVIKRKRLVNRWIAEGFIQIEDGKSKTKIGERYFNELISRSLIQPLDIKYDGQARACRVHDTILDFIVSKSLEENFITFLGAQEGRSHNTVRRISIHNIQDVTGELAEHDVTRVRSLTIFGNINQMPRSLLRFSSLRVLDLKDYLPPKMLQDKWIFKDQEHAIAIDVAGLFHLKYLDLSGPFRGMMSIKIHTDRLLAGIGNLQYLETLDLRNTPLSELPNDIYKLQQLVRLYIGKSLRLPARIGQMKQLEELKVISIDGRSSLEFLQELGQLSNMGSIVIHIKKSQTNLEQESILISSLYKIGMCSLHSLTIDLSDDNFDDPFSLEDSDGHSWQAALQSLRKFNIKWGYITKVPEWMGSLRNLEKLQLGINEMEQEDLDILGDLHSLLYLFLEVVHKPKERFTFRGSKGFPCLKYLHTECTSGMMLRFEAGSMPSLEHLQFDIRTYNNTTSDGYNFGIEHLYSLTTVDVTIRYMKRHEDGLAKAAETTIRNAVDKLPNNPTLRIEIKPLLLRHR
ncbi:disease resistance protein RGA5-like [Phragmites australis]|uniref:disease resistance protein RGA5-like n=1 Tax=Phragmites australis TaxID=29695 RepID=UPI002D79784B|nr:disease resistance protein RGA5-like [Phragmites australis]